MTLNEIGLKYGTDKSSICHNYLHFYDSVFAPIRNHSLKVLEIGIKDGASIKMWRDYFPNAYVVGCDINECEPIRGCSVVLQDATEPNFLMSIDWDIIIDDGSHYTHDQIEVLKNYTWKKYFVMEDLHTSFIQHYINSEETTWDYIHEMYDKVQVHQRFEHRYDSVTGIIFK